MNKTYFNTENSKTNPFFSKSLYFVEEDLKYQLSIDLKNSDIKNIYSFIICYNITDYELLKDINETSYKSSYSETKVLLELTIEHKMKYISTKNIVGLKAFLPLKKYLVIEVSPVVNKTSIDILFRQNNFFLIPYTEYFHFKKIDNKIKCMLGVYIELNFE